MAISLKNHEDRITALEKKSTQGATLSPVKLWSGDFGGGNLTIVNLSKYGLIACQFSRTGMLVVAKNQSSFIEDDQGDGRLTSTTVSRANDDILKMVVNRNGYWSRNLIEVWGIG